MGIGYTSINFATDPLGNPIRTMGENFIYPTSSFNTPESFQSIYEHPDKTLYEIANPQVISIESAYGLGNPGSQRRFDLGSMNYITSSFTSSLDKVNGQVIYSSAVTGEPKNNIEKSTKDLVMFKVGVIDINTYETNYMHFRSFIDSFSDSYSSDWSSQTYMGRGEKLYKYNSFDRSINMSFTVAAQSRGEMASMYQKLNYLASTVTPQYTDKGYMTGNIAKLTVGGYIKDQHSKIDSISYEIPEESPWLINSYTYKKAHDNDLLTIVDELPFIIKVQMRFTPIHDFRPELATNVLNGKFGDQRYITKKYEIPEETLDKDKDKENKTGFARGGTQNIPEVNVGAAKLKAKPTQGSLNKLFTDGVDAYKPIPTAGYYQKDIEYNWEDFGGDIKAGAKSVGKGIAKGAKTIGDGVGNAYRYVKDKLTEDKTGTASP